MTRPSGACPLSALINKADEMMMRISSLSPACSNGSLAMSICPLAMAGACCLLPLPKRPANSTGCVLYTAPVSVHGSVESLLAAAFFSSVCTTLYICCECVWHAVAVAVYPPLTLAAATALWQWREQFAPLLCKLCCHALHHATFTQLLLCW
jgi:hypothetical protein